MFWIVVAAVSLLVVIGLVRSFIKAYRVIKNVEEEGKKQIKPPFNPKHNGHKNRVDVSALYCNKNPDPKGGHDFICILGKWFCTFCGEPR